MLSFVVDKNIPFGRDAFAPFGEVTEVAAAEFTSDRVRYADVLVVRSETKVNQSLLRGSRVKFVGTTTIGIDHLDTDYLRAEGISFAGAPGCNANAVKEYIVAALLFLSVGAGYSLKGKTLGVVGVGNVGSKVVAAARALGMTVLENDPPLARSTGDVRFLPLDGLMDCDILTLHTPLTRSGQDPTYHLFDERRIRSLKAGAVLINTSRGAVVETPALKRAIAEERLSSTVIDVWDGEPSIDADLLSAVTLGTPHIAGYSVEGKINGVCMVRDAVCRHFGLSPAPWDPVRRLEPPRVTEVAVSEPSGSTENILHDVVRRSFDIALDDTHLREMLMVPASGRGAYFTELRSGYRMRREFSTLTVRTPAGCYPLRKTLGELGFNCFED